MRKYVIVPLADVTNAMINSSVEGDISNCRISNSNNVILKFDCSSDVTREVFLTYEWYNREDIKIELQKSEWLGGGI